jgi:hypothetical protein
VAQFERGGESQADFCQRRGLGLSALQHWLYRLRREQREGRKPEARFVPVVVGAAPTAGATACKLKLGDAEVCFAALPPPSYIAEVLRLMDR